MSRKVLLRISIAILVLLAIFFFYRTAQKKNKTTETPTTPTDFTVQPADSSNSGNENGDVPGRGPQIVIFGNNRTVEKCAPPPKIDSTAQNNQ